MDVGCIGVAGQALERQFPGHRSPGCRRRDVRSERPPRGAVTSPFGVGTSCEAFMIVATLIDVAWLSAPLAPANEGER